MTSMFQNLWPVGVNFHLANDAPTIPVPTNTPTPHYQFPAQGGYLPGAAVPSKPTHNLKAAISKLPSLFNIHNAANS